MKSAFQPINTGSFAFSLEKRASEIWAWVEKYLLYLADVRGMTRATCRGQRYILGDFARYLENRCIEIPAITSDIVQAYALSLYKYRKKDGTPLAPGTISLRFTVLRLFCRYLYRQNLLLTNPAKNLPSPKTAETLPRVYFTAAEMEKILQIPDVSRRAGLRARAILETFYSTGMRKSELLNLHINDIDLERGAVRIRQGKGQKDRVVPIGSRALQWIERYMEKARPVYLKGKPVENLFVDHYGNILTGRKVSRAVAFYIERAALGKTGGCHSLRHTCATLMLTGGASIRHVQEMLGHSRLETTQYYTRVMIPELKEMFRKYHPFYFYDVTEAGRKSLRSLLVEYVENHLAGRTWGSVKTCRGKLLRFINLAEENGVRYATDLTEELFAAYEKYVNSLPKSRPYRLRFFTVLKKFLSHFQLATYRFRVTAEPLTVAMPTKKKAAAKFVTPAEAVFNLGEKERALLESFMEYETLKGYAKKTLKGIRRRLKHFFNYLAAENLALEAVRAEHLATYQTYLCTYHKKDGSPISISERHGRALDVAHFFDYLQKTNKLLINPAEDMEFPKLPRRLPMNILSAEEFERIFSVPALNPQEIPTLIERSYTLKIRTMTELFLATGIRRAELCEIKLSDINRAALTLFIRAGKGLKDRVVPLTPRALYWIDEYLTHGRARNDSDHLFLGEDGKMHPKSIGEIMVRIFRKAGIKRQGTCHLFRHTLATMLMEAGAELRHIQELLGHRSIDSTDIYTHVSIAKLKEVHTQTHPAA